MDSFTIRKILAELAGWKQVDANANGLVTGISPEDSHQKEIPALDANNAFRHEKLIMRKLNVTRLRVTNDLNTYVCYTHKGHPEIRYEASDTNEIQAIYKAIEKVLSRDMLGKYDSKGAPI